jgi:hypothetical protein
MGNYIYRVTAKIVDTPVGKANVAVFAYKPWSVFDHAKNARLHFKTGCVASERMFDNGKPTRLVALVNHETGVVDSVFGNPKRMPTFSDGSFGQAEYLPTLYTEAEGAYTFTARREQGEVRLYGRGYPVEANGRWVVRNQRGDVIGVDQYQNDLTDRYLGLVVEQPALV